jgi:hypothetical protein
VTRALLVILALLALFAALGGGVYYWLDGSAKAAAARLEAREAYWDDAVKTAVPLGAGRDKVEAWLATLSDADPGASDSHGYNADSHAYFAKTEAVDAGGLRFPCAARDIEVQVTMGEDGTVIRREAHAGGCGG